MCGVLLGGPGHTEFRYGCLMPLLPRLLNDVKHPPGLATIEELEWGKPSGGLWDLPHREQQGLEPLIPIFGVFFYELTNHVFQRAIKSFDQAVRLWVVDAGANRFN